MSQSITYLNKRPVAAISTMGFSAVLFLAAVLGLKSHAIIQLEHQLLSSLAEFSHPWLNVFFNWATLLGDFNVVCPVVVFSSLILLYKRQFKIAGVLCLSFFGASLTTMLLKAVFDRPRPELFDSALQYLPINAAFPSGHTTHAAVIAVFLAWLAFRQRWYLLLLAAGVLVTLVALSRLYLQIHWPTDLLGGSAVSLFWVSFAVLIIARLQKKREQNA